MTVFFQNSGLIPLAALRTMGVSVKEGTNPVGMFGTGLKYAIATLLRTGHRVEMWLGKDPYLFSSREEIIRGKAFQIITMKSPKGIEDLAFTTDLGKNWKVWQAYRELRCNAEDEGGSVVASASPSEGKTLFRVVGPDITKVHRDSCQYFIRDGEKPIYVDDSIEIYEKGSANIFYRGIFVGTTSKPNHFTYNVLTELQLTEDRTLAYIYCYQAALSYALSSITNKDILAKILQIPDMYNEDSVIFLKTEQTSCILQNIKSVAKLSTGARALFKMLFPVKEQYTVFELDDTFQSDYEAALNLVYKLDQDFDPATVTFVTTLQTGVHGLAEDGRIYIPRETLEMGVDYIASTLYEEWLHVHNGFDDCSRRMQNFLFQKIISLVKRTK